MSHTSIEGILKTYRNYQLLWKEKKKFLISCVKPRKSVSRDTISSWANRVLQKSGINTKLFTSHSTIAASAYKAKQKDIPLADILSQVDQSTADTFRKFYVKPIVSRNDNVASAILRDQTLRLFLLSHLLSPKDSCYSIMVCYCSIMMLHVEALLWQKTCYLNIICLHANMHLQSFMWAFEGFKVSWDLPLL